MSGVVDLITFGMSQWMYGNAIYYFRKARRNHASDGNESETLRNLCVSLILVHVATEACVNAFIDRHIQENRSTMSQKDVIYWSARASILCKLTKGVELYHGVSLEKEEALWKDFQELNRLRNDLVHYRINIPLQMIDALMSWIEKGIRTTSSVIKRLYLTHPDKYSEYPSVFDCTP